MCKFCNEYWSFKEENAHTERIGSAKIAHRYKASLVVEIYKDDKANGKVTGRPRLLNYCPSCGIKLNGVRKRPTEDN